MGLATLIVQYIAPVFLITSPLTSYADQYPQKALVAWILTGCTVTHAYSLHPSVRSSTKPARLNRKDFSKVPDILSRSIIYWFGERFETSLVVQSCIMVVVQTVLLKVALDNRPGWNDSSAPFASVTTPEYERPYQFWQWKAQRPYWEFLAYFVGSFGMLQLLFGDSKGFVVFIGYLALSIEATLPIPQVVANFRNQSCVGFRVSVIFFWLMGDVMKGFYFTHSITPLAFKLCGLCQFMFDLTLAWQFYTYGSREPIVAGVIHKP